MTNFVEVQIGLVAAGKANYLDVVRHSLDVSEHFSGKHALHDLCEVLSILLII